MDLVQEQSLVRQSTASRTIAEAGMGFLYSPSKLVASIDAMNT